MLNLTELSLNIFVLTILQTIIQHMPVLSKYNDDIKFNYYRSLMCLSFTLIGLNILTNHFTEGFNHPFSFLNIDMIDIDERNRIELKKLVDIAPNILNLLDNKNFLTLGNIKSTLSKIIYQINLNYLIL